MRRTTARQPRNAAYQYYDRVFEFSIVSILGGFNEVVDRELEFPIACKNLSP